MGAFGGLVMTNRGLALQAKAQAGAELRYTRVAIGDGYLGGQSIATLNNLINERMSLDITKLKVLGQGRAVIGTVLTNQGITTGFYFREIGIFALDPDEGEILYAYANAGSNAEYIPPGGGPDVVEKHIDSVVVVGQAPNVTATIDKSLVFATLKDLNDHRTADVLDHPDGSVTTEKLADGAVTDNKIGDRTISDTSSPSGNSGKLTTLLGWLAYMIRAITGKSSWRTAPATTLEAAKAHMDATTGVHGATSAATPNTIIQRDPSGRAKVAAPSAADDIARKDTVDSAISSHIGAADPHTQYVKKTGDALTGPLSVPDATANSHAINRQYADNRYVNSIAVYAGGNIDPNTTTDAYILTQHPNSPVGGVFWHIHTKFYSDKTGNRAQVAQRYSGGDDLYIRNCYNGNWSQWQKIWHAGNDGAGSGLDADMLDGMQPSASATGNTIVQRDSSGRIKAAAPSASDDVVRKAELDGHANRTDNPHGVTKEQVGLGNVQNYGIATQAQAQAGTANNVYMTPLRTKEAIDRLVFGNTSNITLYVSPSGDDSNSGTSSGSPLKTIQAALAKIPKLYFGTANINLAAGTYNEDVEITGFMGNGNIHLNGASALEQASSYKVRSVSSHDNTCYVRISGIEGTSTSTSAGPIRSTRDSMCWIRYCLINVSATSSPGFEFNQTRAHITECTVNNRGRAIIARYSALVTVDNVGGSGNSVGLRVESGGVIAKVGGSMPGGSTSESITTGGEIR